MKTSDFLYIGIKGSVVALDRNSGQQVWVTHLKGSDFVNLLIEDGKIFASCHGEIFCLDSLTGEGLWHNRLKGFGTDLSTMSTDDTLRGTLTALEEQRRRNERSAAAE